MHRVTLMGPAASRYSRESSLVGSPSGCRVDDAPQTPQLLNPLFGNVVLGELELLIRPCLRRLHRRADEFSINPRTITGVLQALNRLFTSPQISALRPAIFSVRLKRNCNDE